MAMGWTEEDEIYPDNWERPERSPIAHKGDRYASFADDKEMQRHMGCASSGCNECRSRIDWHRMQALKARRGAGVNRPKWRNSDGLYWIDDPKEFKATVFALKLWRDGKTLSEAVRISGEYYEIHELKRDKIEANLFQAHDYKKLTLRDREEQCR